LTHWSRSEQSRFWEASTQERETLTNFFQDADAAFLMVKTDWNNIEGHYSAVAQRFVDAKNPPSNWR
jgi:hypothetical protein